MYTIFRDSRNSKISDPHRVFLNHSDKINLRTYLSLTNMLFCQILPYSTHINMKKSYETINVKYQLQHGTRNLKTW